MPSIVGIPQIDPAQVRRLLADTGRRSPRHRIVDAIDLQIVLLLGIVLLVEIETVDDIVDPQVSRLGQPFAEQHGAVVGPARIESRRHVPLLLLGDPENRPVAVIGLRRIVPYVVLVGPCGGQDAVVPDSRNGRRFAVRAGDPAAVGPRIAALGRDPADCRRFQPLNHIGRNTVHDDKYRLFRLRPVSAPREQQQDRQNDQDVFAIHAFLV